MVSRHSLSKRVSNKIIRNSTKKTKAVNVKPPLYRGGIRY